MPRKTWAWAFVLRRAANRFNEAAARCRGKLRPRRTNQRRSCRFNEAAARCRGKRRLDLLCRRGGIEASMRPRPDAAENAASPRSAACQMRCFNEAAARCRGKPAASPSGCPAAAPRFNEAAARCRGKRVKVMSDYQPRDASMRPRPDAAENLLLFVQFRLRIWLQ